MEVRIYTPEMNLIGIMENQTYIDWGRKYDEPGTVTLYTPITPDNIRMTALGNLIWMKGAKEAAVIEDRMVEESKTIKRIIIGGRFLSSYLDRRLIRPKVNFSGKVETAMRQLITNAEPIPLVYLGEPQGFTAEVSFQATYKNLMDYETKLARSANLGYRFRPDFTGKKIYFEVYSGLDRSLSQNKNNRVIFSESYGNLENAILRENNKNLKNCVYIGGQGEGDERIFASFGTELSGLERRELYIDARDLSKDDLSDAQYQDKLLQRGREKLSDYEETSSVESETNASGNFTYKTNYDLGDIVSVKKESWGITVDLRITEIHEIYERGTMRVVPTFGTPLAQSIDWSDE